MSFRGNLAAHAVERTELEALNRNLRRLEGAGSVVVVVVVVVVVFLLLLMLLLFLLLIMLLLLS